MTRRLQSPQASTSASQLPQRHDGLLREVRGGKLPEAHDLGDDEAVLPVILCLTDVHLPERLGLDGVDDLYLKALIQQIPVHAQPVVAGGLHADEQVLFGDVQPLEQRQQFPAALFAVGK